MSASEPRTVQAEGVLDIETTERLHVLTGAVCNNNCLFCMEEDREGRYRHNSAITPADVRELLENNVGRGEVMFTSGEPTLNPEFLRYVAHARKLGYRTIGVITNGRIFSRPQVAAKAVRAGLNHAVVSIHGSTSRLHERLVRTPGAFDETLAGIRQLAQYRRLGLRLHTSTVLTRQNHDQDELRALHRMLGPHVDQMILNVIQPWGRGETHFDRLVPRHGDVAREFAAFVGDFDEPPPVFLIDIPYCTTEGLGIPDFNRGYVERYVHHDVLEGAPLQLEQLGGEVEGELPGGALAKLVAELGEAETGEGAFSGSTRDVQDQLTKVKDARCARCRYDGVCDGVWRNYVRRHGWDEIQPVEAP